MDWQERSRALLGNAGLENLKNAKVLLFGVGGVGSFAAEALARAGVGNITLVDGDMVNETNINRQLIALRSTLGQKKVSVMTERIKDINPEANVTEIPEFYGAENADSIDFSKYDYIADAVDMVTSKLLIAEKCRDAGVRLISAMGAGNKLDPSRFKVTDISKTEGCPLARIMRKELRKRDIRHLKVVFSPEEPVKKKEGDEPVLGSVSFVPSVAGLMLAGEIIRDISGGASNG